MNPDEYVRECLFPGDPVGYQKAKDLVMERYRDAPRFPFPRVVRYG